MFTGIIEETGRVKTISAGSLGGGITVSCSKVLEGTKIGDSIAINGICLTVTNLYKDSFTADIMRETLNKTSLSQLTNGSYVNLERALRLDSRLGGHLVSGHIDGVGVLENIEDKGIAVILTIKATSEITGGIVDKGSIAVDGISLTVVEVWEDGFSLSLIPHTMEETNLKSKSKGDLVNLETDMIGKYVAKLLKKETSKGKSITEELLQENGFF